MESNANTIDLDEILNASSDTPLCNHHKYVKNLVNICKKIFNEEQLSDVLKEINAVLCVTDPGKITEYGGCDQTRKLMETIREQMKNCGFIDSDWSRKVDELCKQKKSGEDIVKDIRECRSCKITEEFINSFVDDEKRNGYRERDKKWNYDDDGLESDNKYYYANALDHYITHLVYGIVKTQTGEIKFIRFLEKGGLKEIHEFLVKKEICIK